MFGIILKIKHTEMLFLVSTSGSLIFHSPEDSERTLRAFKRDYPGDIADVWAHWLRHRGRAGLASRLLVWIMGLVVPLHIKVGPQEEARG